MISLSEVRRAKHEWHCGWFVAWSRLRCRGAYWSEREMPRAEAPAAEHPAPPASAGDRDSA